MLLVRVEQVDKRAGCQNAWRSAGQAGQMTATGDDQLGSGRARKRYEVVVLGIGSHTPQERRILDDDGRGAKSRQQPICIARREPLDEVGAADNAFEFGEQRG